MATTVTALSGAPTKGLRGALLRIVGPLEATLGPAIRPVWTPIRRVLSRLGRWGRAALDKYPLTALGTLLVFAALLVTFQLGRKHQDVVLYVVGLGAVGVVLVAAAVVIGMSIVVAFETRALPERAPERVQAGQLVRTEFSLAARGWLPLWSLGWDWESPSAVRVDVRLLPRGGRFVEEVIFGERGQHSETVRRIVIEDVLGLSRIALRVRQVTPRTVEPALGLPLAAPLLEAFAGGDAISHPAGPPDGDPVDMRRYAVGDPMKRILWKVYARTRNLMVRLPERAISPTRRTLAYLVAGEGDEAAAGVARLAVESQSLGPEWRFSADQPEGAATSAEHDASDPASALALIVRSRAARARGGDGLSGFLARQGEWGGRCVIFAPAHPGPWLLAVEAELKLRPGQIEVVLGVDGVRDADLGGRWRRYFLVDDEGPGDDLAGTAAQKDELDRLTRRLMAQGATVTVVDRPSGKLHARSARRRRA